MRRWFVLLSAVWQLYGAEIVVDGDVVKAVRFDKAALAKMEATEIKKLPIVCRSGDEKVAPSRYRGVLLSRLLEKVAFATESFKAYNTLGFIVEAHDGYRVLFSYNELFNSPLGEKVLAAYEKDGKPFSQDGIVLLSGGDTMTGPRHVRDVKRIEVRQFAP